MYREEVKQFLEGADIYDLNYKTLTDVAPDVTKQIFGATFPDKRVFIRKNAKALYNMLPLNQRKRAVGLKTATGLKNILQKAFLPQIKVSILILSKRLLLQLQRLKTTVLLLEKLYSHFLAKR